MSNEMNPAFFSYPNISLFIDNQPQKALNRGPSVLKARIQDRVRVLIDNITTPVNRDEIVESVLQRASAENSPPTGLGGAPRLSAAYTMTNQTNAPVTFNFNAMNIDTMISAVMLDRYEALESLVQQQAKRVQQMNDQLRALGMLKALLAVYGNSVSDPDKPIKLDKPGSKVRDIADLIAGQKLDIDLSQFGIFVFIVGNQSPIVNITQGNLAKLNQTLDSRTTTATNVQSTEYNKLQDYAQKLT